MKYILYIPLMLFSAISFAIDGDCIPESFFDVEHKPQDMLTQVHMYTGFFGTHRLWQTICTNTHPENKKYYETAFKGKNFELIEKSLKRFLLDPKVEWELLNNDKQYRKANKPPSTKTCSSIHNSTVNFVKSFDSETPEIQDIPSFIDFATNLSMSEYKNFEEHQ